MHVGLIRESLRSTSLPRKLTAKYPSDPKSSIEDTISPSSRKSIPSRMSINYRMAGIPTLPQPTFRPQGPEIVTGYNLMTRTTAQRHQGPTSASKESHFDENVHKKLRNGNDGHLKIWAERSTLPRAQNLYQAHTFIFHHNLILVPISILK